MIIQITEKNKFKIIKKLDKLLKNNEYIFYNNNIHSSFIDLLNNNDLIFIEYNNTNNITIRINNLNVYLINEYILLNLTNKIYKDIYQYYNLNYYNLNNYNNYYLIIKEYIQLNIKDQTGLLKELLFFNIINKKYLKKNIQI